MNDEGESSSRSPLWAPDELRSHALDPNGSRCDTVRYAALRDEWVEPQDQPGVRSFR
jgi:hypothetical protein